MDQVWQVQRVLGALGELEALAELEDAVGRRREHQDMRQEHPAASHTQPEDIRVEHSLGGNPHTHREGPRQGVLLRSIAVDNRGIPVEAYRSLDIAAAGEAVAGAEHQVERPGDDAHVEDIQARAQAHRRGCEHAQEQQEQRQAYTPGQSRTGSHCWKPPVGPSIRSTSHRTLRSSWVLLERLELERQLVQPLVEEQEATSK